MTNKLIVKTETYRAISNLWIKRINYYVGDKSGCIRLYESDFNTYEEAQAYADCYNPGCSHMAYIEWSPTND